MVNNKTESNEPNNYGWLFIAIFILGSIVILKSFNLI